jgi:polygalacturonase
MRTISLIISVCLIQSIQAKNFNIIDLGAKPDGLTLCTDLIQKAVDDCSASGGGTVTIPGGVFLSGTIFLKNNVILNLESGAILLGSTKIEDYKPGMLIRALKAHNIGITGNGTIDGQGPKFWIPNGNKVFNHNQIFNHIRPAPGGLIHFEGCKNVIIENVTLKNSEAWTLHLLACNEVLVSGIKIRNPLHGPNTDGIDIQASTNIQISDCDIYTMDDAIVFKNRNPKYYGKACENITINNCILTTICSGFKIGTESLNDFKNIVFSNSIIRAGKPDDELAKTALTFVDQKNYKAMLAPISGISIETVDGANLYGITITNIVMENILVPIFIRLANRGAGEQKVPVPVPGTLHEIIISNIIAYDASYASSISAIPGYYVENVILKNILIRTRGGGDKKLAEKKLDENIQKYPEGTMWGPMPVSGLFIRHVKGLQMIDIKIIVGEDDLRPLVKFDDVSDLYINNLQTNDTHKGESIMDFNNVKNANLINIDFPESIKIPWLFFKGIETENIKIRTIDNIQSKTFIKTENIVKENAIKNINKAN